MSTMPYTMRLASTTKRLPGPRILSTCRHAFGCHTPARQWPAPRPVGRPDPRRQSPRPPASPARRGPPPGPGGVVTMISFDAGHTRRNGGHQEGRGQWRGAGRHVQPHPLQGAAQSVPAPPVARNRSRNRCAVPRWNASIRSAAKRNASIRSAGTSPTACSALLGAHLQRRQLQAIDALHPVEERPVPISGARSPGFRPPPRPASGRARRYGAFLRPCRGVTSISSMGARRNRLCRAASTSPIYAYICGHELLPFHCCRAAPMGQPARIPHFCRLPNASSSASKELGRLAEDVGHWRNDDLCATNLSKLLDRLVHLRLLYDDGDRQRRRNPR